MKKIIILSLLTNILLSLPVCSFGQDEVSKDKIFILRKAQEHQETIVGVEAYLTENILEVTITARMHAAKPKIFNAVIMGPKLGRKSPDTRQMIFAKIDDEGEDVFMTENVEGGGLLRFGKKTKEKEASGALTKELMKFKIAPEKIIPGKEYKLWIQIEGMQETAAKQTFKFDLDKLAELIHQ